MSGAFYSTHPKFFVGRECETQKSLQGLCPTAIALRLRFSYDKGIMVHLAQMIRMRHVFQRGQDWRERGGVHQIRKSVL